MSPELLQAVKERVVIGHTREQIFAELKQAGYDEAIIEQVYQQAQDPDYSSATDNRMPTVSTVGGGEYNQPTNNETVSLTLPGAGDLIHKGLAGVIRRWDLFLLLLIPQLVIAGVIFFTSASATPEFNLINLAIIILLSLLNVLFVGATVYGLTNNVNVKGAIAWVQQHYLSILWIFILSVLVVSGGFMLLIVPGLIVLVTVSLALTVYVKEGLGGMSALRRSRDLIKGYWWAVTSRLLAVLLVMLLVAVPLELVIEFVTKSVESYSTGWLVVVSLKLVSVLIDVVYSLVMLQVLVMLYDQLTIIKRSVPVQPATGRWQYATLAWFGLLLPVLGIVASVILASLNSAEDLGIEAGTRMELNNARVQAESFYQTTGSYAGVCNEIKSIVTSGVIDCFDNAEGWAMTVSSKVKPMQMPFCVDNDSAPGRGSLTTGSVQCDFMDDKEASQPDGQKAKERANQLRQQTAPSNTASTSPETD